MVSHFLFDKGDMDVTNSGVMPFLIVFIIFITWTFTQLITKYSKFDSLIYSQVNKLERLNLEASVFNIRYVEFF